MFTLQLIPGFSLKRCFTMFGGSIFLRCGWCPFLAPRFLRRRFGNTVDILDGSEDGSLEELVEFIPKSYHTWFPTILKTGQREDIGLLRTPDGLYAYGLGGAETDKHGRIWVVGAFEETDEEYVVRRITALLAHSNGLIYDATRGRTQSYLFLYSQYINKVRPLGKIADAKGIYHCLLEGKEGKIYIGTGMNMLAPVKLTKDFPVEYEGIEKRLWKDICAPYQSFEGGTSTNIIPKRRKSK